MEAITTVKNTLSVLTDTLHRCILIVSDDQGEKHDKERDAKEIRQNHAWNDE